MSLDEATRGALAIQLERLRSTAPWVAWLAAENLHLTLKFLGDVALALLPEVGAGLESGAATVGPFTLEVRGLGAFPSVSRPRVVWAGVTRGQEAITTLAARIDTALEPMGFVRAGRPFSPHVTLGRLREPRRAPRLARAIEAAADAAFGVVPVDAVRLMRSDLSPHGARYSEIAVVRLSSS